MEAMGERLALEWVAGRRGTGRMLRHEPDIMGGSALVGHLNLIHPNQIQVIGHDELAYLNGLRRNSRQDVLEQICGESAVMLIVCDGLETPATLTELAEQRPQTVNEALGISGIGPVKAETVIPRFLDVIRARNGR